ncbi:MAG: site-specific DNA-methyltransferase [Desulfobacterales bacterium]|nr:site-specific DNA-methyltransferase [Desulfobacterales bacterium]
MKELPINQVVCGDAFSVVPTFPKESVDMVMTSPSYWGLRDYKNPKVPGMFAKGGIGLEPHPQMYIDRLVVLCRLLKRVLKKTGSMYLVMGDTYFGSGGNAEKWPDTISGKASRPAPEKPITNNPRIKSNWLQPKQLMLIPSRTAIALQNDGWILRNDGCWYKKNHMPGSQKDRLTCSWEHIFHFVKSNKALFWVDQFTGEFSWKKPKQYYVHRITGEKRFERPKKNWPADRLWYDDEKHPLFDYGWQGHCYFYDLDAIRKPHKEQTKRRAVRGLSGKLYEKYKEPKFGHPDTFLKARPHIGYGNLEEKVQSGLTKLHPKGANPGDTITTKHDLAVGRIGNFAYADPLHVKEYNVLGKNPGDFLSIPTKPFPQAHFAVYPEKICEDPIKASCPAQICVKCGKPRKRLVKAKRVDLEGWGPATKQHTKVPISTIRNGKGRMGKYVGETVGFSDCSCAKGFEAGVVLDPMCGSGTTLVVAHKLGRNFVGIDLNPSYVEMARKRLESVGAFSARLEKFVGEG